MAHPFEPLALTMADLERSSFVGFGVVGNLGITQILYP